MVHYRRNLGPGGTFFFTVALANRRSSALVESITSLRQAFKTTGLNDLLRSMQS